MRSEKYFFSAFSRFGFIIASEVNAHSSKEAKEIIKKRHRGLKWISLWGEKGDISFFQGLSTSAECLYKFPKFKLKPNDGNSHISFVGYTPPIKISLPVFIFSVLLILVPWKAVTIAGWVMLGLCVLWVCLTCFKKVSLIIDKKNAHLLFEEFLFLGLIKTDKEKITFQNAKKVVCEKKHFKIKNDPCTLFFVYLLCEDEKYLLSQSSSQKHELKIANHIAKYLEVLLEDRFGVTQRWPGLENWL